MFPAAVRANTRLVQVIEEAGSETAIAAVTAFLSGVRAAMDSLAQERVA